MKSASRTLVKSQPELWELIDQPERMQGLMCGLLGRAAEVTVNEREPESVLSWQAAGDGEKAWIKVELAEKGWGTHVEVSAENVAKPVRLDGWLDAVLEELAMPQKRPFRRMTEEAPAEEPAVEEASTMAPPPEPVEEPDPEPEPVEETPVADEAPASAPAEPQPVPAPRKKFFGLF